MYGANGLHAGGSMLDMPDASQAAAGALAGLYGTHTSTAKRGGAHLEPSSPSAKEARTIQRPQVSSHNTHSKLNHSLPDEDDVSLMRDQSHAGHHSSRPDQQHGYGNGLRHQQQHSEQEDGHQHGQEEDLLSLEPDQQELGQEEQGAVGEHQEQHVLTDTIANGIAVMDQQLETIEQKVRELTAAGLERLDLIKQGFADAMEAYVRDLRALGEVSRRRWIELAAQTLHENERLGAARDLVNRLGIEATVAPTQDGGRRSGSAEHN